MRDAEIKREFNEPDFKSGAGACLFPHRAWNDAIHPFDAHPFFWFV